MTYCSPVWTREPTSCWPYRTHAYLLADSEEELEAVAMAIGCEAGWAQGAGRNRHFDLTAGMRRRAVTAGATPLDMAGFRALLRSRLKNEKEG